MISETTVMMLIAIQFGFMAFVLMKLDMKKGESDRLKTEIEKSLAELTIPDINFDELKAEMLEIVEDLISSIRIPTFLDHAAGAVSMFMQQKMQRLQEMPQHLAEDFQEAFASDQEDF